MLTEEQRDTLALYGVTGIGSQMYQRLVARFGSPSEVFRASTRELMELDGIGTILAGNIKRHDRESFINDQVRLMEKVGASILIRSSDRYPASLNAFKSAPPVLFVRGEAAALSENAVAFVGTRKPTDYGIKMTRKLVAGAVDTGLCVVSGMAAGIDATAHREALDCGGHTVAVFGCGVDTIYPSVNRRLSEDIMKSGCLISHFPMGTPAGRGMFPARNAVIVGISLGTVVVEAPKKSGALITADLTLRAGRKLFAVPGNADSDKSVGTNDLISRGAQPIVDSGTLADIFGMTGSGTSVGLRKRVEPQRPRPDGLAGKILAVLDAGSLHIDEISQKLDEPVWNVLSTLTELDMDNFVIQKPGKVYEVR